MGRTANDKNRLFEIVFEHPGDSDSDASAERRMEVDLKEEEKKSNWIQSTLMFGQPRPASPLHFFLLHLLMLLPGDETGQILYNQEEKNSTI